MKIMNQHLLPRTASSRGSGRCCQNRGSRRCLRVLPRATVTGHCHQGSGDPAGPTHCSVPGAVGGNPSTVNTAVHVRRPLCSPAPKPRRCREAASRASGGLSGSLPTAVRSRAPPSDMATGRLIMNVRPDHVAAAPACARWRVPAGRSSRCLVTSARCWRRVTPSWARSERGCWAAMRTLGTVARSLPTPVQREWQP